jgi:hypothetical protein
MAAAPIAPATWAIEAPGAAFLAAQGPLRPHDPGPGRRDRAWHGGWRSSGLSDVAGRFKGAGSPTPVDVDDHYEYFVCPRNQRDECPQSYQPTDLVEAAVETHYTTITITEAERDEIRQAISTDLGERVATAKHEIDRCRSVLREVREQERKLLNMHYEDRITNEFFDDEQTRLRHQREDAEALITHLNLSYQDIAETLDLALEIISEDLHDLYQRADDTVRRLLNQAPFNALYICDETITKADLAGPFAELRALHNTLRGTTNATRTPHQPPPSPARSPKTPRPPRPGGNGGLWTLVRLATLGNSGVRSHPSYAGLNGAVAGVPARVLPACALGTPKAPAVGRGFPCR